MKSKEEVERMLALCDLKGYVSPAVNNALYWVLDGITDDEELLRS